MDVECIESDGDYSRWVVAAYRKASCGAFKPTKVRDSLDREEEMATISFELGGRRFRKEFEQPDDYVADDVHAFMNRTLASLGGKRRFHFLPSGDQTVGLVCVTPKTYARARRLGLIPARVSQV